LITSRDGILGSPSPIGARPDLDAGYVGVGNPLSYWDADIAHTICLTTLLSGIAITDDVAAQSAVVSLPGQDPIAILRPTEAELLTDDQLGRVLSYARLRGERVAEIEAQVDDLLSFFASILNMHPDRHRHTFQVLELTLDVATACVLPVKHSLFVKRPADLSERVQPMLGDPGHGSCPSGHATEATAVFGVLCGLLLEAWGLPDGTDDPYASRVLTQLHRLAQRIADNRIVAGLHYPVDNERGVQLGTGVGAYVIQSMRDVQPLPQVWRAACDEWRIAPRATAPAAAT